MHNRRVDAGPGTRLDRTGNDSEGKVEAAGAGPWAGNEGRSEFLRSSGSDPSDSEPVELGGTSTEAVDDGACAGSGDIAAEDALAAAGRSGGSIVTGAGAAASPDSGADDDRGRKRGSGLEAGVY